MLSISFLFKLEDLNGFLTENNSNGKHVLNTKALFWSVNLEQSLLGKYKKKRTILLKTCLLGVKKVRI